MLGIPASTSSSYSCHVCHLAGINVLLSGGADEFAIGLQLNSLLIPALVGALKVAQPLLPYPPDPQVYEGGYTEVATNLTASIITYNSQLVISSVLGNYYLSYWEPLRLQVGGLCVYDEQRSGRVMLLCTVGGVRHKEGKEQGGVMSLCLNVPPSSSI